MGIRKTMDEEIVVAGSREAWLEKCSAALRNQGFSKVTEDSSLHQVRADYKKFSVWGEILITLTPQRQETRIHIRSTANIDNLFALLRSPNKKIISLFKKGLE